MATTMQSILDQLAQYGFDTSEGIGDWSSQDIATTMGTHFGQTPFSQDDDQYMSDEDIQQAFLPSMFTRLSPELIKASSIKQYSPMIQTSQSSLLSELLSKTSGKTARRATGGFAGQSLQSIQDLISKWAEHAQEIAPASWEPED